MVQVLLGSLEKHALTYNIIGYTHNMVGWLVGWLYFSVWYYWLRIPCTMVISLANNTRIMGNMLMTVPIVALERIHYLLTWWLITSEVRGFLCILSEQDPPVRGIDCTWPSALGDCHRLAKWSYIPVKTASIVAAMDA